MAMREARLFIYAHIPFPLVSWCFVEMQNHKLWDFSRLLQFYSTSVSTIHINTVKNGCFHFHLRLIFFYSALFFRFRLPHSANVLEHLNHWTIRCCSNFMMLIKNYDWCGAKWGTLCWTACTCTLCSVQYTHAQYYEGPFGTKWNVGETITSY